MSELQPSVRSSLPAPAARIRAVVAHGDTEQSNILRDWVELDGRFEVSSLCFDLTASIRALDEYAPELLVCEPAFVTDETCGGDRFPLFIVAGKENQRHIDRIVSAVSVPLRFEEFQGAITKATAAILAEKAAELSSLMNNYLLYQHEAPTPPRHLLVDHEGRSLSIAVADVSWIEAEGNYVRLHTDSGTFVRRETISNIAARLQPCGFRRIHRSVVVNVSAIAVSSDDSIVRLHDGTSLAVGRNFRSALDEQAA